MPHYHVYFLDRSGHIERGRDLWAVSDAEAYQLAETLNEGRDWELWHDTSLIAKSVAHLREA